MANTTVTRGKSGLIASVQDHGSGATYDWTSFSNGVNIALPGNTRQITYTPVSSTPSATLDCVVTNPLGDQTNGTLQLNLVEPAEISSMESSTYVLTGANHAAPAAALTFTDPNPGTWAYDWTMSPNSLIGSVLQPLTGVSFTGNAAVLTVAARNQAGDSTAPISANIAVGSGATGMTIIAGRTGGPGSMDGTGTAARVQPSGIAPDLSGGFLMGQYFCCPPNEASLSRITLTGGQWATAKLQGVGGGAGTTAVAAIAPLSTTSFFAGDNNGFVSRYDNTAGVWTQTRLTPSGNSLGANTNALAVGLMASGNLDPTTLYVAWQSAIYKLTSGSPNWVATLIAGDPAIGGYVDAAGSAARFYQYGMQGLVALDQFTLLVSDQYNQAIRKVHFNSATLQWDVTTIAGGGPGNNGYVDGAGAQARFSSPQALAAVNATTVYVADTNNSAIRKLTSAAGAWSVSTVIKRDYNRQFTEASLNSPNGLALDATKTHLAITQGYSSGNIILLDLAAGTTVSMVGKAGPTGGSVDAPNGPGLAARYSNPQSVAAADPSTAYVADNAGLHQLKLAAGVWTSTTIYSAQWPTVLSSVGVIDASTLVLGARTYSYTQSAYQAAVVLLAKGAGGWAATTVTSANAFPPNTVLGSVSVTGTAGSETVFFGNGNYNSGAVYRLVRAAPGTNWIVQTLAVTANLQQSGVSAVAAVGPYDVFATTRQSATIERLSSPVPPAVQNWTGYELMLGLTYNDASLGLALTDGNHLFLTNIGQGTVLALTCVTQCGTATSTWTTVAYGVPGQRAVVAGPLPPPMNPQSSPLRFNAPSAITRIPGAAGSEFLLLDQNEGAVLQLSLGQAALSPVNLGSAANYLILAKSAISNIPNSTITGDVGLSPAAASFITGFGLTAPTTFSTSSQVTGKVYASDFSQPTPGILTTAVGDMQTAYTDAAGRANPDFVELGAGSIGGLTLAPGLYKWTTNVSIPTDVTLSGSGTDVWIFQISGNLSLAAAKRVLLSGGARASNVFWQVAGQAILGTTAHFEGNILAQTSITLQTGASMNGRTLAQTAVALDHAALNPPP